MKLHIEHSFGAAAAHTFSIAILNDQGKIETVNSKFLALTGYTEKERSIGQTKQTNET